MSDGDAIVVLAAWARVCNHPAGPGGIACSRLFEPILNAYQDSRRHYHNLSHIAHCLEELEALRPDCDDPDAVRAAILFHDCVYDPTRVDNEEQSADMADDFLRRVGRPPEFTNTVRQLILATKHAAPPPTRDAAAVVDVDLAILGKTPKLFDEYEWAVRREYTHVPDPDFAAGRAKVLRQFLARPAIYHTPPFASAYERPARENLRRSLARLERGEVPG